MKLTQIRDGSVSVNPEVNLITTVEESEMTLKC